MLFDEGQVGLDGEAGYEVVLEALGETVLALFERLAVLEIPVELIALEDVGGLEIMLPDPVFDAEREPVSLLDPESEDAGPVAPALEEERTKEEEADPERLVPEEAPDTLALEEAGGVETSVALVALVGVTNADPVEDEGPETPALEEPDTEDRDPEPLAVDDPGREEAGTEDDCPVELKPVPLEEAGTEDAGPVELTPDPLEEAGTDDAGPVELTPVPLDEAGIEDTGPVELTPAPLEEAGTEDSDATMEEDAGPVDAMLDAVPVDCPMDESWVDDTPEEDCTPPALSFLTPIMFGSEKVLKTADLK